MRVRVTVAGIAAALVAVSLAACGSSSGASSSASSSPGGSTGSSSGSASAGVVRAKQELQPLLKLPTSIGISTPLKASPKGKTVDYIECGVTECKNIGDSIVQAAGVLGIKVVRVAAGNTPESTSSAFQQAVSNHPDGVITSGVSKSIYAKQLAELRAAKIPVVAMGTADLPGDGLAQVLLGRRSYLSSGRDAADWSIVDSNAKAKVLLVTAPVFDFNKPLTQGFQATMKQNCPGCSVHVLPVSADAIGQAVPGQIVSYLQRNPDTNYVITSFGSLMLGVPAAVRGAGLSGKVSLFTVAASQADFKYAKTGLEKGNLSSSTQYLGWVAADQIARAMTGQHPAQIVDDAKLPWFHLFTKKDITWNTTSESGWPYFNGYQAQFSKLWSQK